MGKGAIVSVLQNQKLNTKSSTEAELVGADDASSLIVWTKLFLEAQGYKVEENILCQDNRSTVKEFEHNEKSFEHKIFCPHIYI